MGKHIDIDEEGAEPIGDGGFSEDGFAEVLTFLLFFVVLVYLFKSGIQHFSQ